MALIAANLKFVDQSLTGKLRKMRPQAGVAS
jgi:hypothetical protein